MNDRKRILNKLILKGEDVKTGNYISNVSSPSYIKGPEYENWISECQGVLEAFYSSHPLKNKFFEASKGAVGQGLSYYDTMQGVLKALESMEEMGISIEGLEKKNNKPIDKIFISHATEDKEYVREIIQLLNDIGIKKNRQSIFCSSFPGYDIPVGEPIYEYIKKQFDENVLVLFILSDKYYDSAACLNEMGATWVTSQVYHSVLLPGFEFSKIKGAIDPTKISFKANDKLKLNGFRKEIISLFNLESTDSDIWEQDREKFLENIEKLTQADKYKNSRYKIEVSGTKGRTGEKIEIELRFINLGEAPIIFGEVNLSLEDENGNILCVEIDEDFLENIPVYQKENRREIYVISGKESLFNPRRFKLGTANCTASNLF
ncbi:TIR domain-containing protein [Priestia megaterium]|uniref:toll/interleukin-1 receptor domain-containing protein n=1 Tax=Priestia megaterium TaxID=1404 RepID=UPI000BF715C4|nr:toll/interleukin-1 receptor domain-containing protein [Priestia megaterium]PFB01855.1 TIR domain-containing protein [Priestia megaterium]